MEEVDGVVRERRLGGKKREEWREAIVVVWDVSDEDVTKETENWGFGFAETEWEVYLVI